MAKKKRYVFVGCADPSDHTQTLKKGSHWSVSRGETIEFSATEIEELRAKGYVFEEAGEAEESTDEAPSEPEVEPADELGEEVS